MLIIDGCVTYYVYCSLIHYNPNNSEIINIYLTGLNSESLYIITN